MAALSKKRSNKRRFEGEIGSRHRDFGKIRLRLVLFIMLHPRLRSQRVFDAPMAFVSSPSSRVGFLPLVGCPQLVSPAPYCSLCDLGGGVLALGGWLLGGLFSFGVVVCIPPAPSQHLSDLNSRNPLLFPPCCERSEIKCLLLDDEIEKRTSRPMENKSRNNRAAEECCWLCSCCCLLDFRMLGIVMYPFTDQDGGVSLSHLDL